MHCNFRFKAKVFTKVVNNYIYACVCLTEEYRQVGINFVCSHWWIWKEKDSLKLTVAVKIEEMQIYKPVIRCHLLVHGEKEKINSPYTNKTVRLIYRICLQCLYTQGGVNLGIFCLRSLSHRTWSHRQLEERFSKRDKQGAVKKDREKEGGGRVEKCQLCSGKGTQVIPSPSGIPQRILLSPRGCWSETGVSEHSLLPLLPGCLVQHQKKRYVHKRFVQKLSQSLKIQYRPESELNTKSPQKNPACQSSFSNASTLGSHSEKEIRNTWNKHLFLAVVI